MEMLQESWCTCVVHRCHPETEHISTQRGLLLLVLTALHDGAGVNYIAQGLAHLQTLHMPMSVKTPDLPRKQFAAVSSTPRKDVSA